MTLPVVSGGHPPGRQLLLVKYGVIYPQNSMTHVLTKPASPVVTFDAPLRQLILDMFHTMYAMQGVGLAATQVGLGLRVAVADASNGRRPADKLVLINPEMVESSGEQTDWEGCLSLPGFKERVTRPNECWVRAQDERGDWHDIEGEGLLARILCHEIDHLDGKLYTHRISSLKRSVMMGKIKKLKRQGRW